ncbi:MAG: DUF3303 family protein [Halobacteriota archaeon]
MVVAKHTAEDCPGGLARPDKDFLSKVVDHIESSGVAVTEIYLDAPGHVYFLIVEAHDNEALNNVLEPFRLVGKVKTHPVLKLSDAITWTKKIGIQR